jgi:magnesium transporter
VAIFGINFALQQSQALTYTVSIALVQCDPHRGHVRHCDPLAIDRLKVDPALATGPFVTTLNDIFGLLTYFTVGHFMYDLFP